MQLIDCYGIGNWELGIGNWELGIGNCTECSPSVLWRSRKACGIATLRAQPLLEKHWALSIKKLFPIPHSQFPFKAAII
jgi:hypothetical protein